MVSGLAASNHFLTSHGSVMKRITIHLPAVLLDWLESRSDDFGVHPSQVIAHLLAQDLEKHFAPPVEREAAHAVSNDGPIRQAWLFPDPALVTTDKR